ncbi:MAG: hypothetical protein ACLT1J_06970 [Mediterraneibacter gnavus]
MIFVASCGEDHKRCDCRTYNPCNEKQEFSFSAFQAAVKTAQKIKAGNKLRNIVNAFE